jgi:hypothetical protein
VRSSIFICRPRGGRGEGHIDLRGNEWLLVKVDSEDGYRSPSKNEAVKRLPHLLALDRRRVRQEFEQRFSAQRMAGDHVRLYQEMLKGQRECLLQSAFQINAFGIAQQADQLNSAVQ